MLGRAWVIEKEKRHGTVIRFGKPSIKAFREVKIELSTAARYFYVNKATKQKQWNYPDASTSQVTISSEEKSNSDDAIPAKRARSKSPTPSESSDPPLPPLPDLPLELPPPPPPQPEDDGYDVDDDDEADRKIDDDGIMMEISDEEKEQEAEGDGNETASAQVLSQQAIIYKGPEVSLPYRETRKSSSPAPDLQSYFMQSKNLLQKPKPKKTKVAKKSGPKKPYKAMSSLVAQWQRAKNEIEEEDRMLEESDEEEKEEATEIKIAKWKLDQISSGKAVSNPNFEPVPTDWRTRLLEKKKKKL